MMFTFVDLLCGIGGFRFGLERLSGKCLLSVERDEHCRTTYKAWFGEQPLDDIWQVDPHSVPPHDILCAGFPCQPFSVAGVPGRNHHWKEHGFQAQDGDVFFALADIIQAQRPKAFLLENVKNLRSHDDGKTWRTIETTLRALNYDLHIQLIDAVGWVPQHRQRLFIVGFDRRVYGKAQFSFPIPPVCESRALRDILEPLVGPKYTLSDRLWQYLKEYAAKQNFKKSGFGFSLADLDGATNTLTARYANDGSEILIPQGFDRNPRKLTPRECLRLMGFDEHLKIVVSDRQSYHQFGNAVVPGVVESIGYRMLKVMNTQAKVA